MTRGQRGQETEAENPGEEAHVSYNDKLQVKMLWRDLMLQEVSGLGDKFYRDGVGCDAAFIVKSDSHRDLDPTQPRPRVQNQKKNRIPRSNNK